MLKCLDRSWQPKVMTISEMRDFTTLSIAALFRKLREHELEMNRFKEQEIGERKARGNALKTAALGEESETDSRKDSEAEALNLQLRKFNKFPRKKGKEKNKQSKGILRRLIQMLLTLLVLVVESRDISRWNVQIWLTKKRLLKRRNSTNTSKEKRA